jgi:hypothetical protein
MLLGSQLHKRLKQEDFSLRPGKKLHPIRKKTKAKRTGGMVHMKAPI